MLQGVERMKLFINDCYGGFNPSEKAKLRYSELTGLIIDEDIDRYEITRDDPNFIQVIEELGDDASGCGSNLKVVEIPDDVDWIIDGYDGKEWITEPHRVWS